MPNNRRRGRLGENEFAEFVGGERISRTGEPGSDVRDSQGRTWEVKRIKQLWKRLERWLDQAKDQGDYGVAFRANRGKWYVIVEAEKFFNEANLQE